MRQLEKKRLPKKPNQRNCSSIKNKNPCLKRWGFVIFGHWIKGMLYTQENKNHVSL